ncbi:riboflavin deaminase [bacterium]|nr:riboflavin deaminase [bacterium]
MQRPHIICHMITSLDGRLLAERWPCSAHSLLEIYDGAADRLGASGWIVGRRTMEHYIDSKTPVPGPAAPSRTDHVASHVGATLAICVDRHGTLHPESGELDGEHLVLVLSEQVPDAHVEMLIARGVSVIFAGPEGDQLEDALIRIGEAFGVSRLLLEGGGRMNGAFLAADLIDETSTLIYPVVDGQSGVASIYDHDGPIAARGLELISSETLDTGTVWLRHRVLPRADALASQ